MRILAWKRYLVPHLILLAIFNSFEVDYPQLSAFLWITTALHWLFTPSYVPDLARTKREIRFFLIQLALFQSSLIGIVYAKQYVANLPAYFYIIQLTIILAVILHWSFKDRLSQLALYPNFLKTHSQAEMHRQAILQSIIKANLDRKASYMMLIEAIESEEDIAVDQAIYGFRQSLYKLEEIIADIADCDGFYTMAEKCYWMGYVGYQCGIGYARIHDNVKAEDHLKSSLDHLIIFESEVPYGNEDFSRIVEQVCDDGYLSVLHIVPSLGAVISEDQQRAEEAGDWYEELINTYIPMYSHHPYLQAAGYRKAGQFFVLVDRDKAYSAFKLGIETLEKHITLEESISHGDTTLLEMKDWLASLSSDEERIRIQAEINPWQHLNTWRVEVDCESDQ